MKRFHLEVRSTCRICGGGELHRYLDLGAQPPANSFIAPDGVADEQAFPLEVYLCRRCGLSQLVHVVAAADIFDDYVYLSSTSEALCRHYRGLARAALADFDPPRAALAVDIGCNDGILLKGYPPGRLRLLGVEPSSAGRAAEEAGFEVTAEFFDAGLGARLRDSHGAAALVTATNVIAHVDDIASFVRGAQALLAPEGVFIIEFPYLGDMLRGCYFDTVYHEHLSYLALTPLRRLFADSGLRAFRLERTEVGASGPALRLFVCRHGAPYADDATLASLLEEEGRRGVREPAAYDDFAGRVAGLSRRILEMIRAATRGGGRIGAFGAPAKGNTLLNALGLTASEIVAAAENNALKIGKLTPGSHIPIVDDAAFLEAGLSHALLLAWNYAEHFLATAPFIKRGGKFIVPLPEPSIRP